MIYYLSERPRFFVTLKTYARKHFFAFLNSVTLLSVTPDPTLNEASPETRSTAGMTTKVVKGSLWTLAGQVFPLGASLVATPFVIRFLGAEGYGVFILVGLIPTYLGFADMGMSIASTKFGSEAYAAGDAEREARTVRTAAVIALCAAVPAAMLIAVFSSRLVDMFNVPEQLAAEAALALKIASVTFVLNFLNAIFNTPQLTRLRMDLNTLLTSGLRMGGIIATPIVIYFGGGILGAVVVLLIVALATFIGHLSVSSRLLPQLLDITVDRSSIRPLLKFGGALTLSGIAGIVLVNAEKGMLSTLLSPKALAYYYVAFTLVNMMAMFSSAMVQSILPAFSQLQDSGTRSHLNSLYSRGIRMNLIWLVPSLVSLSIIAKPFFTYWAGPDFGRESVLPFYIMLGGIVVNVVAYFPHSAILASGRTDVMAKLYLIEVIPYVLIVWGLTFGWGISGVAAAWSMRAIVDALIIFVLAKRFANVQFQWRHAGSFAVASFVMLLPFPINLVYQNFTVWMIGLTAAAGAVYSFIIWKAVLESEEVGWLTKQIQTIFAK